MTMDETIKKQEETVMKELMNNLSNTLTIQMDMLEQLEETKIFARSHDFESKHRAIQIDLAFKALTNIGFNQDHAMQLVVALAQGGAFNKTPEIWSTDKKT